MAILCCRLFATKTSCCVAANVLCKLVNSLPVLCITAGIYTIVVMSIERVRCILPARGQDVPTSNRSLRVRGTVMALVVVWILSAVMAVPAAVNFDVGVVTDTGGSNQSLVVCHTTWSSLQTSVYSLFLLVVSYLLPQVVLYINYGRLAAFLWRRRRVTAATGTQQQSTVTSAGTASRATLDGRRTLKTMKLLATVAILFLAAWAPYFTITTIEVNPHFFLLTRKDVSNE